MICLLAMAGLCVFSETNTAKDRATFCCYQPHMSQTFVHTAHTPAFCPWIHASPSPSARAQIMQREGKLAEAEQLLDYVNKAQLQALGPEHTSTLETMGSQADLLRKLQREPEAQEIELRLYNVSAGRGLDQ